MAEAVELRGVAQVAGDAHEPLADQEGAEGGGQERHGQAGVGVEPGARSRMVCTLGISVTSIGSISVAMNTANSTRLNGKRRNVKA